MKKQFLIIGGVVILVLLLAGAAFVGGRLLNGQGLSGLPGVPGGPALGGGKPGLISGGFQPAKELPQTPADVNGVFDHRQDNSLFVGTGNVTIVGKMEPGGNLALEPTFSGPIVEVLVTSQTKVYQDVTMKQFDGPPPEGQTPQQVVELGALDDIGDSSRISVWGRKTGDRLIADVLVYSPAAFIKK